MELSVIIPTYKETSRLNRTLAEILPYLKSRFKTFEIIVVDDPSAAGRYTRIEDRFYHGDRLRLLKQPKRLGKGAAVRRGCLEAAGDIVLFMDADHSTPIVELDKFLPYFKAECMVSGVRTYQDDESRWRRIIGLAAQLFLHLVLFSRAVVDSQCGFKAFSRGMVQKIFPLLRVNGGMVDAEIFFLVHKFDLTAFFEPVHWKNKPGTKISVLKCMINDPIEIFGILLRDLFGNYVLRKRPSPQ
jgi:dolichyl-phosphate beta-glucosyltransferase